MKKIHATTKELLNQSIQVISITTNNIIFLDTESDPISKEPLTIQTRYNGVNRIWNTSGDISELADMWNHARAIIMYNAPYDLGVLSSLPPNFFEWDGNFWKMVIFENKYRVRRISGFRNIIKGNPPVIDLLKLWAILINDGRNGDIKLKTLIKQELGIKPIKYSEKNAQTEEYQLQDVIQLEALWRVFLQKTRYISHIDGYTYNDWAAICTPATFCKRAMKGAYPQLPEYRKSNIKNDAVYSLKAKLERAYHGGITVALHRGFVPGTAWYDISGAYAHAIEFLNSDNYIHYFWKKIDNTEQKDEPSLHKIISDAFLESVNKSLKIFRTDKPAITWMWNFDIAAMRLIFPDLRLKILESYKPMPLLKIEESKAAEWNRKKEEEEQKHGKTTLRDYYKAMANTAYGITAQRNPYTTAHTNLCIAGILSARTRLVLAKMVAAAREIGCRWIYSDTDSICVELRGMDPDELCKKINDAIYPFTANCEHIGNTRILSLKRYIADADSNHPDKIRLHGKSLYHITQNDIKNMLNKKIRNTPLKLASITASTERTYNRILKLDARITHPHPFMFINNITSDIGKREWFEKWIVHIDTKTSYPFGVLAGDEFPREFIRFTDHAAAEYYYNAHLDDDDDEDDEENLIENSFFDEWEN